MPPRSGIAATSVMPTSGVAQFERVRQIVGRERADEDLAHRLDRIGARDQHERRADEHGEQRSAVAAAGGAPARQRARAHAACPAGRPSTGRASPRSASARGRSARMRPSNITRMRSLSARISLSSAETSSTAWPLVALGDELAVDEFDRADVDAARRLLGDQHRRAMRRVRARPPSSADCRRRASRERVLAGDPDAEPRDQLARPRRDSAPGRCRPAARQRRRRGGSPSRDCRRRWRRARCRRWRDPPEYRRARRRDAPRRRPP